MPFLVVVSRLLSEAELSELAIYDFQNVCSFGVFAHLLVDTCVVLFFSRVCFKTFFGEVFF